MAETAGKHTRRELFGLLARTAAAGVLAVVTGAVLAKSTGRCVDPARCRGCGALPDCSLPPAQTIRKAGSTVER